MDTVKVVEPRVNVKHDVEKSHVVLMGGRRVTEQAYPSNNWQGLGQKPLQMSYTIEPPSNQTIVDRYMKVRCYFEISCDQDLQLGTNDALRQYPIASLTENINVQINGAGINDNLGEKVHAYLCYGNDNAERQKSSSTTPNAPDAFQEYADWQTYGSAKNPLANYGENSFDPRGGFPVEMIDSKTFRVVVTEGLLLSPFFSGVGNQEEGFVNIDKFLINFRFKNNLSQILSHSSAGNAITEVNVSMYQAPEILVNYITPDLTTPIPSSQILPYHSSQDYIKVLPTLLPGASTNIIGDTVRLNQVPRRVYVFCRHQRSTSEHTTSDSFLRIDRCNVMWNNESGVLNTASTQDLFELSKRNGCNLSWSQWYKYRGSVLCIELGKDIGLGDNEAPGVVGNYTIQISLDVTNTSTENFTAECYMVFMMEGTMTIMPGSAVTSLANLTPDVVLASKMSPEVSHVEHNSLQGGGFFSGLKNFVNKVAHGVSSVANVAGKIAGPVLSVVPGAAPVLSAIQTAGKVADVASNLTGGSYAGGRLAGGRIAGGRMSRRHLKQY